MLRFFPQIRQHLLTQKKFSKYLLYPIGQVVPIVVAILIVLQIGTWN